MRARLIVERGIASPRVWDLNDEGIVLLGRNGDNTIVLRDRHASRRHAEIFPREGRWFIRDHQTTNGTRVGGEPIQRETPLQDGDEIGIGDTRLRFTLELSKASTGEMPVFVEAQPSPLPNGEMCATVLQPDEMTALFRFMNESLAAPTPHRLVSLALETVRRQTNADLAGFLSLDTPSPELMVVLPEQADVEKHKHLSEQLTSRVRREGRSVWLGANPRQGAESDSLSDFRDAVCIPLRVCQVLADSSATPEPIPPPLGALHVYKVNRPFRERDVRFCEVLAGCLAGTLHALRARRALEADNSRLRVHSASPGEDLLGDSPAMAHVRQQVSRLADAPCTVLITGESGVGKELVALALHRQSRRHGGPLVPVNCAALTASMPESELFGHVKGAFTGATRDHPGFFLQAGMGTLFLDEIGELSLDLQAKLLRAIETKSIRPVGARAEVKVDVRIITATNRDLEREVREGRFRQDLLFRLRVSRIEVPPLRDHAADIPVLVENFLARLAAEYRRRMTLTESALQRLQDYSWPGNVRQLRSVLEAAVAMADKGVIHAGDLHLENEPSGPAEHPPSLNLEELEAWAIREALAQTGGNNTHAARLLGIHRDTLISKQRKYGIERRP
jgi:Nif-specific regulatory protein